MPVKILITCIHLSQVQSGQTNYMRYILCNSSINVKKVLSIVFLTVIIKVWNNCRNMVTSISNFPVCWSGGC